MPKKKTKKFQKGDIVRYTANFLRSTGQYKGASINGLVTGFQSIGGEQFPMIQWNDYPEGEVVPVHPDNLELDPRARRSKNPAEAIAASAIAYTDSLERQVDAIRSGSPKRAVEAQRQSAQALRELKATASQGVAVPAAVGAAVGGGLGAIMGAPGAAVGGLLGAMMGAVVGRGLPSGQQSEGTDEDDEDEAVPTKSRPIARRPFMYQPAPSRAANRGKGRKPNKRALKRRLLNS